MSPRHAVVRRVVELEGVGGLVMVSGRMVVDEPHLALRAYAGRRAQHGSRHRAPDGEQDGKQQQEPDANGLHKGEVSRRTMSTWCGLGQPV